MRFFRILPEKHFWISEVGVGRVNRSSFYTFNSMTGECGGGVAIRHVLQES